MKRILPIIPILLLLTGCSLFGTNPSPPSALEQKFFNTVTNYHDVIVLKTNLTTVTITNTETSFVYQTNPVNGVINVFWVTNQVGIPVLVPQITTITQSIPGYTLTPNATTTATIGGIGTVTNMAAPGFGGLVGAGLTALVGLWGYLRSYKPAVATKDALSQEMETVLEFIKALPNGATYKTALTNFLAAHQADAGVVTQVANLLANEVSNPDAKVAAQQVIDAINALQVAAAPGAPSVPASAAVTASAAPVLKVAPVSLSTPVKS
jgi:hypothetical protein